MSARLVRVRKEGGVEVAEAGAKIIGEPCTLDPEPQTLRLMSLSAPRNRFAER
jgi:hypothetical protein